MQPYKPGDDIVSRDGTRYKIEKVTPTLVYLRDLDGRLRTADEPLLRAHYQHIVRKVRIVRRLPDWF